MVQLKRELFPLYWKALEANLIYIFAIRLW